MWYDRKNIMMMFFFGAALAFIGLGVIMMDHLYPGLFLLIIGVAVIMISFTILRLHVKVSLKR